MADRRRTPDILGDLLGGSRPPTRDEIQQKFPVDDKTENGTETAEKLKGIPKTPGSTTEDDIKHFEDLLEHAGSALVLVAEVLGYQRLVNWLEDMLDVFSTDETVQSRKAPGEAFKQNAANWAKRHLGAKNVDIYTLANGLVVSSPYEVDVWAQFEGEGAQADLDVWIECRDTSDPVKKTDIMKLVQKVTDVFHASHAGKQDFWFDRLILISNSSFNHDALELAQQMGVACVNYDGTNYTFATKGNWKLKPNWLKDAEASEGITWHSPITKKTS
ncbi:MAG: hypothetical protein R6U89_06885 [Dehalococcoidia bacterium]